MDELLARVPPKLHDRFREIVALTDEFCAAHLNDEYRDLCRTLAADACAAKKVPVATGKAAGWAAGVLFSVGYANFLTSDPNQPFHMSPDDMAKRAGVSVATMHDKAKAIRGALRIDRFDPRYTVQQLSEQNPLSTTLALFEQLLNQPPRPVSAKVKKKRERSAGPTRVYTLDVSILSGPITKAFAKKNRRIVRTIEIRGDQTLEELHWAIYDAFDRDDPHMYEFQFGNRPMDPKGPRYIMPEAAEDDDGFGPPVLGIADETTIDEVGLKAGQRLFYWFDFGDDWHHQIDVVKIAEGPAKGKFPRVTKRVGESPPQYLDWDAEE